eukprot:g29065.t1
MLITDADCAAIAPYLKKNTNLRQLFIGYNDFSDEGARHLCEALSGIEGGSLELVGFRHCKLGNGAADALNTLQEQNYREVDEQLHQAQLLLEDQTRREKDFLRAQASQAKEVAAGRWDQHLRAQEAYLFHLDLGQILDTCRYWETF